MESSGKKIEDIGPFARQNPSFTSRSVELTHSQIGLERNKWSSALSVLVIASFCSQHSTARPRVGQELLFSTFLEILEQNLSGTEHWAKIFFVVLVSHLFPAHNVSTSVCSAIQTSKHIPEWPVSSIFSDFPSFKHIFLSLRAGEMLSLISLELCIDGAPWDWGLVQTFIDLCSKSCRLGPSDFHCATSSPFKNWQGVSCFFILGFWFWIVVQM